MWLILTLSVLPLLAAYRPPKIKSYDSNVVLYAGDSASVPCPVEPEDGMFFNWKHNGRSVNPAVEQRYRISWRGELKILGVEPRDSGVYTCRAINGFGNAEVNVTATVRGESSHLTQDNNLYPDGDFLYPNQKVQQEPHFSSRVRDSVLRKREGSSVHFKCNAEGEPPPEAHWYKNGKSLAVEGHRPRRGSFVLRLDNLREADSGTYTCLVHNVLGSISTNFTLDVEVSLKKPEFLDDYPVNYSVTEGGHVTLKCHVLSKVETNIKWLEVLSEEDLEAAMQSQNLLLEKNDYFRVLNFTSNTTLMPDGSYLNSITIPYAKPSDDGQYVCCATNLMGYNTRRFHLHVLSTESSLIIKTTFMGLTKELMVVISALTMTFLAVSSLICLVSRWCCVDKRKDMATSVAPADEKSSESEVKDSSPISRYRYYQIQQREEGSSDHLSNDTTWWSDCEDINKGFISCSCNTGRSWNLDCDIYENNNAKFTGDDSSLNIIGYSTVSKSLNDLG